MTQREFFTKVIETSADETVIAFAKEAVAKLDKRNKDKADKDTDKKIANRAITAKILAFLADNPKSIGKVIAEGIGEEQAKVIGLCGVLVKDGALVKEEISIPKVGKRVAFSVAPAASDSGEGDEEVAEEDAE